MEKSIYFRAFEEEDADLIYQWMNDDELKKLSFGVNHRMCRSEALDWVTARKRDSRSQVWWAICSTENDKMIGYTYLTDIHYINRCAEYGGLLIGDPDYRDGNALIEAFLFVLEYAFERLNLHRLYGYYMSEHQTTRLMMDAVFFKTEGIQRLAVYKNGKYHDVIFASILADEYFKNLEEGNYSFSSVLRRLLKERKK